MRLSIIVANKYKFSRRYVKKAIKEGLIRVDNNIIYKDINTTSNNIEYIGNINVPKFDVNNYILKKTDKVIFLYKPPFIHSQRLKPSDDFTISDILDYFQEYRSISRLDYETDGIIAIVNKNYEINSLKKRYLAIVEGSFPEKLNIKWSIDADNKKKVKIIPDNNGNYTEIKKIRENNISSLIEITLEKANRHQIRAICSYAGYPIIGDKIYGGINYTRLCLHSESILVNDIYCDTGIYKEKFMSMID